LTHCVLCSTKSSGDCDLLQELPSSLLLQLGNHDLCSINGGTSSDRYDYVCFYISEDLKTFFDISDRAVLPDIRERRSIQTKTFEKILNIYNNIGLNVDDK
jgi:hypothetical protein